MTPSWHPDDDLEIDLQPRPARREVFAGRTWGELLPLMAVAIVTALLYGIVLEFWGGI